MPNTAHPQDLWQMKIKVLLLRLLIALNSFSKHLTGRVHTLPYFILLLLHLCRSFALEQHSALGHSFAQTTLVFR